MATETAEGLSDYHRSLVVTGIASVGGVIAGYLSLILASSPGDRIGLIVLAGAVVVELAAMWAVGVDVQGFSTKDQLYVIFMTFALWFVSWTVLLTTAA